LRRRETAALSNSASTKMNWPARPNLLSSTRSKSSSAQRSPHQSPHRLRFSSTNAPQPPRNCAHRRTRTVSLLRLRLHHQRPARRHHDRQLPRRRARRRARLQGPPGCFASNSRHRVAQAQSRVVLARSLHRHHRSARLRMRAGADPFDRQSVDSRQCRHRWHPWANCRQRHRRRVEAQADRDSSPAQSHQRLVRPDDLNQRHAARADRRSRTVARPARPRIRVAPNRARGSRERFHIRRRKLVVALNTCRRLVDRSAAHLSLRSIISLPVEMFADCWFPNELPTGETTNVRRPIGAQCGAAASALSLQPASRPPQSSFSRSFQVINTCTPTPYGATSPHPKLFC